MSTGINPITGMESVLDSRDVIARIEYLQTELGVSKQSDELDALLKLQAEAEASPDWKYGEQLISENYFTQHIEELIADCYEFPKEFRSGEWPYRHMTFDFKSAAQEAKDDYFEVSLFGSTYFIRA